MTTKKFLKSQGIAWRGDVTSRGLTGPYLQGRNSWNFALIYGGNPKILAVWDFVNKCWLEEKYFDKSLKEIQDIAEEKVLEQILLRDL